MRDALSDLLQAETQYAPVVDAERRIAGVLSVEIISEFLSSPDALVEEHPAAERPLGVAVTRGLIATLLPLAQAGRLRARGRARPRPSAWPKNDTVCIGWAIDNFDDYVTPLLEHLCSLTSVAVALGFVIAFGARDVSHRRRWLVPPFTATTGIIYTLPSIALFLLAAADHRARHGDGDHRAHALQPPDHLPQHRRRARQRARLGAGRGPGDGDDEPPAALAGRVAARDARDHRRAADRDGLDGRDRNARGLRRRGRPRCARSTATSPSRRGSSSAGGLAIRWRSASTSLPRAAQRASSPLAEVRPV